MSTNENVVFPDDASPPSRCSVANPRKVNINQQCAAKIGYELLHSVSCNLTDSQFLPRHHGSIKA